MEQFSLEALNEYKRGLTVVYQCFTESSDLLSYMNKAFASIAPRNDSEGDMQYYIGWASDISGAYLNDAAEKVRNALDACTKAIKELEKLEKK